VKRALALAAILVGVPGGGAGAASRVETPWSFRTPGGATYCGLSDGFVCLRPSDGFYIRLTRLPRTYPDFATGWSDRYRGYRNLQVRLLRFGQTWYTSDAEVIRCQSSRRGVTSKHWGGLFFRIGRHTGYRISVEASGRAPTVQPFFRTPLGAYCGLGLDTLEPARPGLLCWTPRDGLLVSIGQGERKGDYVYEEHVKGLRPHGYRLLAAGHTFTWRCRKVDAFFAERCSTTHGVAVFVCTSRADGLRCRNRTGHGFLIGRRSFSVF
jgi:hypothetical protein